MEIPAGPEIAKSEPEAWYDAALEIKANQGLAWKTLQRARSQGETRSRLEGLILLMGALAVEYLAIGLMVHRSPARLVEDPPKHRIRRLLGQCGIGLTTLQEDLLRAVEPVLGWQSRYNLAIPEDLKPAMEGLPAALVDVELSETEKSALDALFARVREEYSRALRQEQQ